MKNLNGRINLILLLSLSLFLGSTLCADTPESLPADIWIIYSGMPHQGAAQLKKSLQDKASSIGIPREVSLIQYLDFKKLDKNVISWPKNMIGYTEGGLEALKGIVPETKLYQTKGGVQAKQIAPLERPCPSRLFYVGHNWCSWIRDVAPHVHMFVLPNHLIPKGVPSLIASKIKPAHGELRSPHLENTDFSDYVQAWNFSMKTKNDYSSMIPEAPRYIGFFLGGDFPIGHPQQWTTLSQETAKKLAQQLVILARKAGAYVLLANGNRTGIISNNHNPSAPVFDQKAHAAKSPLARNQASDPVSQAFIDVLNENQIEYFFYDYRYENGMSAHDAILAKIMNAPDSILIITAESTRRISEASGLIAPTRLFIAPIQEMKDQHKTHTQHLLDHTSVRLFTPTIRWPEESPADDERMPTFSEQIAERLWPELL